MVKFTSFLLFLILITDISAHLWLPKWANFDHYSFSLNSPDSCEHAMIHFIDPFSTKQLDREIHQHNAEYIAFHPNHCLVTIKCRDGVNLNPTSLNGEKRPEGCGETYLWKWIAVLWLQKQINSLKSITLLESSTMISHFDTPLSFLYERYLIPSNEIDIILPTHHHCTSWAYPISTGLIHLRAGATASLLAESMVLKESHAFGSRKGDSIHLRDRHLLTHLLADAGVFTGSAREDLLRECRILNRIHADHFLTSSEVSVSSNDTSIVSFQMAKTFVHFDPALSYLNYVDPHISIFTNHIIGNSKIIRLLQSNMKDANYISAHLPDLHRAVLESIFFSQISTDPILSVPPHSSNSVLLTDVHAKNKELLYVLGKSLFQQRYKTIPISSFINHYVKHPTSLDLWINSTIVSLNTPPEFAETCPTLPPALHSLSKLLMLHKSLSHPMTPISPSPTISSLHSRSKNVSAGEVQKWGPVKVVWGSAIDGFLTANSPLRPTNTSASFVKASQNTFADPGDLRWSSSSVGVVQSQWHAGSFAATIDRFATSETSEILMRAVCKVGKDRGLTSSRCNELIRQGYLVGKPTEDELREREIRFVAHSFAASLASIGRLLRGWDGAMREVALRSRLAKVAENLSSIVSLDSALDEFREKAGKCIHKLQTGFIVDNRISNVNSLAGAIENLNKAVKETLETGEKCILDRTCTNPVF